MSNLMQNCLKRAADIAGSATLLIAAAPALLVIALLVRLSSPGPALFRQQRLGKDGRPFSLLKFRTMYVDAPDVRNPDGSSASFENDSRVTSVGRFLRASSLDELPQLLNVLLGEMSLVGP